MRHDRVWLLCSLMVIGALVGAQSARAEDQTPAFPAAGRETEDTGWRRSSASSEFEEGRWLAGGSMGLLGGTPDDTALALNVHGDYLLDGDLSMGPLLQVATTGDMLQFGLSNQWKYWIPIMDTNGRGKVALQGGVGFVHSDFQSGDTAWLVPLGVGYEHQLASGVRLTSAALLNFTDLNTGPGGRTSVMPGLAFGVRF